MTDSDNPYLRYRERLDSYQRAIAGGLSDQQFVDLVERLDAAVVEVYGTGFVTTPLVDGSDLAAAIDLDATLWIKDETGNVSGSHKARHLFGVAIHLAVDETLGSAAEGDLAIASCGNAALAASVVARSMDRPLSVFVPTWANEAVVSKLHEFGANVVRCERREGEAGDPCYLRFKERVADGAHPFCVQGTDAPTTFDGGRTIGWEFADQVAAKGQSLDRVYVQVGGGALATAVAMALPDVAVVPVQAEGCAPLQRAWDRLSPEFDFAHATANQGDYMWPWEDEPTSIATGILDDVTYDWLPLLERVHAIGSAPVVAPEANVVRAHDLATTLTEIPVCTTGTAGLAGLLTDRPAAGSTVGLLFTGHQR